MAKNSSLLKKTHKVCILLSNIPWTFECTKIYPWLQFSTKGKQFEIGSQRIEMLEGIEEKSVCVGEIFARIEEHCNFLTDRIYVC